ncbi:hypothetical protein ACFCV3_31855 [Kribbella sp. NPDC056345]|uniref:hypothetical protein n=1 Tax=Kribbella sp. NPDC056345 TaxID=3345789 RepID=UPI0035D9C03F
MDPLSPTAQRFPLIPRPRPGCLPLQRRVANLTELAVSAQRGDASPGSASSVFNQAALLASDLDLPELAREWCHRHANIYLQPGEPRSGMDAIRGLEPLVNLARLHIRANRGDQGHEILNGLYDAISTATPATVDSINVPADLVASTADRDEVRQWLWRVILADGTRALISIGRWAEALAHVQRHHGVGERMLDGRQVAILSRVTVGDHGGAMELIAATTAGEAWENAVTACLEILCRLPNHQATTHEIDTLLAARAQVVDYQANLIVFQTRLMLSIVDAARGASHAGLRLDAIQLADQILTIADGYASREVLDHPGITALLDEERISQLEQTVKACALGSRELSAELQAQLEDALDISETLIKQTLTSSQTLA